MSRSVITTVFAFVVLLLLAQYKTTKGWAVGIGVIVLLGYLLTHYPTIRTQFQSLGRTTGGGNSGGGGTPVYFAQN